MNGITVLRGISFGACITLTAVSLRVCNVKMPVLTGIPLQPPSWVFGVVWPILYVTTGLGWAFGDGARTDILLGVVTCLCCAWLYVFSLLKWNRIASLVLISSAVTAIACVFVVTSLETKWLISPLAAWLSFASYLNLYSVLKK